MKILRKKRCEARARNSFHFVKVRCKNLYLIKKYTNIITLEKP